MPSDNRPEKDFTELDPDQIQLDLDGKELPGQPEDDPSQTGRWSGNPGPQERTAREQKVQPDNMPGDTEVQRENWQRY